LIEEPVFYIAAVTAVLIMGIAKGGLSGGIGMVGVPLMTLTISPVQAAAILLPILMVMDAFAVRAYWQRWDVHNLKIMVPGALVGTAIGWISFQYLSANALRIIIGVVALAYGLQHFILKPRAAVKAKRSVGYFWGALAGFTSFGIHAGGPPVYAFLLPQKLDRTTFQATTVLFFFIVNWSKVIPYGLLGQLDATNLATSAVLAPLAPIGIWTGAWLHRVIDDTWFFRVVYVAMVALGCKLIFDGVTG